MRSLAVESLVVRDFRNLAHAEITLGSGMNVLYGDNAQGKTNLLEALYVLATSRSFRTAKLVDVIRIGAETASVRARVREGGEAREQSMGVQSGRRLAQTDGKRPASLATYAVLTPVVVFHPGAVALSAGASSERRKLLDRVALYLTPASLGAGRDYAHALRARQRLLEMRGESAAGADEWEEVAVKHGLELSESREDAAARLAEAASDAFARIGPQDTPLRLRYERSAPRDAATFREALQQGRRRDRARGSAGVGPHRDDIALELGGVAVRGRASQGQHRSVVLALELAEMEVIGQARGVRPILLLDDVSSELDPERTQALLRALRRLDGQVLLTTTRRELLDEHAFPGLESRRDFAVSSGRIVAR